MSRPWVFAGFAFVLTACPVGGAPVYFAEDFEGCDAPCDWTVTGTGSTAIVTTIHPGEHGLELTGEVTITRTFDPPITGAVTISWLIEGTADVAAEAPDGGAVEIPSSSTDPPDVPDELNPHEAAVIGDGMLSSLSFQHHGDAPAVVDAIRVLGFDRNHGCY